MLGALSVVIYQLVILVCGDIRTSSLSVAGSRLKGARQHTLHLSGDSDQALPYVTLAVNASVFHSAI